MGLLLFDAFDGASASVAGVVSALSTPVGALTATSQDTTVDGSIAGVMAALTAPVGVLTAAVDDPTVPDHHIAPAPRLFRASGTYRNHQAPPKDPSEVLDYTMSFAEVLETGETIATAEWSRSGSDAALTIGTGSRGQTHNGSTATLWLLAGTEDVSYLATCHVVTNHDPPREYERSFAITIASL